MSLKQIRGIGAVKQSWLRQVLNIRSIADLADAEAEAIAVRLRQAGHILTSTEIELWISQAQDLVRDEPESLIKDEPESTPVSLEPGWETADLQVMDWQTTSSLTLEYQVRQVGDRIESRTIARHRSQESTDEESTTELFLSSMKRQDHVAEWVRRQVLDFQNQDLSIQPAIEPVIEPVTNLIDLPIDSKPESPIDLTTEELSESVDLFPIAAFPPPLLEVVGIRSQQPITQSQPFILEVMFRLSGEGAMAATTQPFACELRIEIRDRSTGAVTLLTPPPTVLEAHQLSYSVICPAMILPMGIYRILVMAEIPDVAIGQLKIPLLQVS